MTRRPLISGNWKMNLNHFEAIQTVQKLHYLVPKETLQDVDVSIHPPFTDIRSIQTVIETEDSTSTSAPSTATGRTPVRSPVRCRRRSSRSSTSST
jgi:triosephosphate isomerase